MRRRFVLMVALTLTGPAAAIAAQPPGPGSTGPAPERPNVVLLGSLDSMLIAHPRDTRAFETGVLEAFEPDFYLTESTAGAPPRVTMALANRFQLAHGDPFGDEWLVRITVTGWIDWQGNTFDDNGLGPPRTGGSDSTGTRGAAPEDKLPDQVWGMRVRVEVRPPAGLEAPVAPGRSFPSRGKPTMALFFEPHPAGFSDAGRAAGLLAVEALHRRSGDLDSETRLRIAHAARAPEELPRSPHHR